MIFVSNGKNIHHNFAILHKEIDVLHKIRT